MMKLNASYVSFHLSFGTCSILELEFHEGILRRLIRATQHAVQGDDLPPHKQNNSNGCSADPFPETVSRICSLGDQMYPSSIEWSILEQHLVSAYNELTSVSSISQQDDGFLCSTRSELSVLHSINCAKVHLGIALSLVLCPPAVDPLALDFARHLCIHQLVSSLSCPLLYVHVHVVNQQVCQLRLILSP